MYSLVLCIRICMDLLFWPLDLDMDFKKCVYGHIQAILAMGKLAR